MEKAGLMFSQTDIDRTLLLALAFIILVGAELVFDSFARDVAAMQDLPVEGRTR